MFILLAGMTFQSGVTSAGSGTHTALTALVAVVLVGCVTVFVGMLAREVWNSLRFARRRHRRASAVGAGVQAVKWRETKGPSSPGHAHRDGKEDASLAVPLLAPA
jgi:hypothetical protein